MVVRMFARSDPSSGFESEQLSLLVRSGMVITFQERPGDCFQRVRERLEAPTSRRLRTSGADYLAYALLDAVVDGYQPVMDSFEDRLEVIEDRLLEDPQETDLQVLHTLRRELIAVRRQLAPVREVVSGLMRGTEAAETLSEETRLFLRDCYDHVIRTLDQVDSFRELCASLMDLYISTVSNRTNDVMKVLTMIATVFIPLSFLVGLYGMNFDTSSPWNMPELQARYGYPILVGTMLLVAGGLVGYFKKKGWL
ncbi:MAG: magnesium/cobalt transporter CorA [Acidobacteriota bacterium]